jgi:hypothetical protein
MRIRVTTKAALFEERKQQHIERGYRIEEERPTHSRIFARVVLAASSFW